MTTRAGTPVGGVFFPLPQAYVALSRATTLDGLHLLDFRVGVVKAHESVKNFYASLEVGSIASFWFDGVVCSCSGVCFREASGSTPDSRDTAGCCCAARSRVGVYFQRQARSEESLGGGISGDERCSSCLCMCPTSRLRRLRELRERPKCFLFFALRFVRSFVRSACV